MSFPSRSAGQAMISNIGTSLREDWLGNIKADILAGMTVSLALIPEALSFAIVAGVNPMVSLYSAFIIAISVSVFGGRKAMISSSTGSMSLLMGVLVASKGVEYLFAATILAGLLQYSMGRLKLGRFITFLSQPVLLGFVNALGIMIFMAQIPRFRNESWPMFTMVLATVILMFILPRIIKGIPPALICIVLMTVIAVAFGLDIGTVGDAGTITSQLPFLRLPAVPLSLDTLLTILPLSLSLSLVGLLESLLTASVLDEITETKSDKNRETRGQGKANIIAGLFGGMAGCALIGQSIMNVKSGGRGRLSTFISGLFLLVLIMLLSDYVKVIPMAALVGIMIIVCYETMNLKSILEIGRLPREDAFLMLMTMAIMILTRDLAIGVVVGVCISAVTFSWKMAKLSVVRRTDLVDGIEHKTYTIHGHLFFATTNHLDDAFDYTTDPDQVIINLNNRQVRDNSAYSAIERIIGKYQKLGKCVTLTGIHRDNKRLISGEAGRK